MMTHIKTMNTCPVRTLQAFALVVVAALSIPAAQAQQADTSKWACEYCPFAEGNDGSYELGASAVSDDSAYFGNATGYGEEGVYANVDGNGSFKNDEQQLRWIIEDLALDSRFVELEGGSQGNYDYRVAYRDLPEQRFFTTDTIFQDAGAAALTLPGGWVRAPLTSGFTQLDSSLVGRDIEAQRSLLEIGGRYLTSRNFSFSADLSRQEHDGIKSIGGPFSSRASLLPGQFDYLTESVDLGVRYTAAAGYLALDWRLSEFENKNDAFRWENPFSAANGADSGALAQAPDNTFQQLSLAGAYRFAQSRTVLSFNAATGRMEQNSTFLPYTTNTNLSPGPLPATNLNGEVKTTNLALSLKSNVTSRATVRAAFGFDERDNETEQHVWTRVMTDEFQTADAETNTPYSYQRWKFNLSGDYDLTDSVRASAAYGYKKMERDFQEVAKQTTNGGWGGLRWRPNSTFNIQLRGGGSQRDIDSYDEDLATDLGQNPLMRKYNLAYRERYFGKFIANVTPVDNPLSLTLSGEYAEDNYENSQLGLTDAENSHLNADLGWAVSEKVSMYVSGGYENFDSAQLGSEQFSTSDWRATNDDTFYTFGAGVRVRQIGDKVDLQLDYTRSDGTGEIVVDSESKGYSQLPDLTSTLDYVRLKLAYQYSERVELTTRLLYKSFKADDWALQGVGPATIPTVLTLGAQPYDDNQFIIGLGFRYRVGDGSMLPRSSY
jgi:MtrB/PioB family decaheme-associated outer membrane protein